MNWFRANKFLGQFLIVLGLCTLISLCLLFSAKSRFDDTTDELNRAIYEFGRLQGLSAFPNKSNLLTKKTQTADYGIAIGKLKEALKTRVLPALPMQPSEFQARLRQTVTAVTDRARANRVRLPDSFFLGFNQFASTLPSNSAAPLLGQHLAQVELLVDIMIDARIDALTVFRWKQLPEESASAVALAPIPSRGGRSQKVLPAGPKPVESSAIEATFISTPTAVRRVLNQVASANNQFFVIRSLHIVNENDKGPPRGQTMEATNVAEINAATGASAGAKPNTPLSFIVGMERIQTSAAIELVRLDF